LTGRFTETNGAPCEPRFFARAAWLAAIPAAWAISLGVLLACQGFSDASRETRGPAHFHAQDDHAHAHGHVERHHHAPGTEAVAAEEKVAGREAMTAPAGFDVVPAPIAVFARAPIRNRPLLARFLFAPDAAPFLPDRPPPSLRA
jgi:hypothetical protein